MIALKKKLKQILHLDFALLYFVNIIDHQLWHFLQQCQVWL